VLKASPPISTAGTGLGRDRVRRHPVCRRSSVDGIYGCGSAFSSVISSKGVLLQVAASRAILGRRSSGR
jgi:hypothetical protein